MNEPNLPAGPRHSPAAVADLIIKIRVLLAGIDACEAKVAGGWWETSEGAAFGGRKLAQLERLLGGLPEVPPGALPPARAWLVHAEFPYATMDPPLEDGLPRTALYPGEVLIAAMPQPCPAGTKPQAPEDHMYTVTIRDNTTGETRTREMSLPWDGENSLYWWTEGNFACDCNRREVFLGAEDDEAPCGDTRYAALYAELPSGERIGIDEPGRAGSANPEHPKEQ